MECIVVHTQQQDGQRGLLCNLIIYRAIIYMATGTIKGLRKTRIHPTTDASGFFYLSKSYYPNIVSANGIGGYYLIGISTTSAEDTWILSVRDNYNNRMVTSTSLYVDLYLMS